MTIQPSEHCGHQPDPVIGQPTECVLRPGHSGSHADHNGMRWWMRKTEQPTDRPRVDQLTDDQLDQLYQRIDELTALLQDAEGDRDSWARDARQAGAEADQLRIQRHTYRRAWNSAKARARKQHTRAEQAEAAIARVRALHQHQPDADYCDLCSNHGDTTWPCATLRALDGTT